jgi:hypothetical protein
MMPRPDMPAAKAKQGAAHAANLKPGNSGDLKVAWPVGRLPFEYSRQKSSFLLFALALMEDRALFRLPCQKHEVLPTKHTKQTKGNSGRKVVAIPSRLTIFVFRVFRWHTLLRARKAHDGSKTHQELSGQGNVYGRPPPTSWFSVFGGHHGNFLAIQFGPRVV